MIEMEESKSPNFFDLLNDADVKNAELYKKLFDALGITKNLGAMQIVDKEDGYGKIIRFGFFH